MGGAGVFTADQTYKSPTPKTNYKDYEQDFHRNLRLSHAKAQGVGPRQSGGRAVKAASLSLCARILELWAGEASPISTLAGAGARCA